MKLKTVVATTLCASLLLVSCGNGRTDEYSEDDLRKDLGITIAFPDLNKSNSDSDSSADSFINDLIKENEDESIFKMKVYDSMSIYSSLIDDKAEKILGAGEFVLLQELNNSEWANVYSLDGKFMGYAKDGFMHSISTGSEVYAELPIGHKPLASVKTCKIPVLGYVVRASNTNIGYIFMVILPLGVMFTLAMYELLKELNKKKEEK